MVGKSRLRVIGGKWRGRKFEFPNIPAIRPTPDQVRETLFNWMMCWIQDSICLDLFAGSGALSFEAISRGARQAVAVDADIRVCRQIAHEARRFETDQISVVKSTANKFLTNCTQRFDVVFLDPPFGQGMLEEAIALIEDGTCLSEQGAYIYLEYRSNTCLDLPESWQLLRQKQSSQVQSVLAVKNYNIST